MGQEDCYVQHQCSAVCEALVGLISKVGTCPGLANKVIDCVFDIEFWMKC